MQSIGGQLGAVNPADILSFCVGVCMSGPRGQFPFATYTRHTLSHASMCFVGGQISITSSIILGETCVWDAAFFALALRIRHVTHNGKAGRKLGKTLLLHRQIEIICRGQQI